MSIASHVFPTPDLRQHLCLLQRRENLPVEEFVPEFAVEAFDVAVLPRTPRLDEQRLDSQPREPFPDGFGGELGPVIRSDVFRDAVPQHQPGQHPQNVPRALLTGHLDRQALAGELVDHRQELHGPAFAGPLEHEVVRPHVVAIRRPEPDTGTVAEAERVLRSRRNIPVSGGTGSGKTTLLNALIELLPDDERIVAIEETLELRAKRRTCSKP